MELESGPAQHGAQRSAQIRMTETVARRHELIGRGATAIQQHLCTHLAKNKPHHRRRHGRQERPPHHLGQSSKKFAVCHGLWGNNIKRTLQFWTYQNMEHCTDGIVQTNPTDVLLTTAKTAAKTQGRRGQ